MTPWEFLLLGLLWAVVGAVLLIVLIIAVGAVVAAAVGTWNALRPKPKARPDQLINDHK